MTTVDARGYSCPEPVIMLRKAMAKKDAEYTVLVDNMTYIATFFSHFGAVRYKKLCDAQGFAARTMPVPRSLSSSCGTCVRCEGGFVTPSGVCAEEVDRIAEVTEDGYVFVYHSEEHAHGT